MKRSILSLICLLAVTSSAYASDYNARIRAAQKYEIIPVTSIMNDMLNDMKRSGVTGNDPKLTKIMLGAMDVDRVRKDVIKLTAETFTLKELKALHAFYQTPAGRGIYKKMPTYVGKAQPLIQAESSRGMVAVAEELERRNGNGR